MGLATSQVRLLALTSRKADVEMQIQLNSKRKTMLTREATELAKLYYAKLQNTRIQYATTNGNKDVTYNYLMGTPNSNYFDQIIYPTSENNIDRKTSDSMVLTDAYGRVILSNSMVNVVLSTLNQATTPGLAGGQETTESRTISAMVYLLEEMASGSMGNSSAAGAVLEVYNSLYQGTAWGTGGNQKPELGYEILQHLLRNGYKHGGEIYRKGSTGAYTYYPNSKCESGTEITPENGTFYIVKNSDGSYVTADGVDSSGSGIMYWNGEFVPKINTIVAQEICNMYSFYGSIFSAAFNGTNQGCQGFNVAAQINYNKITGEWVLVSNDAYNTVSNVENLQDGLKSGMYQLVNVETPVTGGYSKAQGLDYFKTLNYVVEKADTAARDTITAWYDAARADLNEKESYWDSEITALSSELNSITTEIESVKKLREDAISSTFKWGGA